MKKYHHTKGAFPLFDDPRLYLNISDFGEGPQVEAILDGTYVCTDNKDPSVKTFLGHLQLSPTVSGK